MKNQEVIKLVQEQGVGEAVRVLIEKGFTGNKSSLYAKINATYSKYKKALKTRGRAGGEDTLTKFYEEEFLPPQALQNPRAKSKSIYPGLFASNELKAVHKVNEGLAKELSNIRKREEETEEIRANLDKTINQHKQKANTLECRLQSKRSQLKRLGSQVHYYQSKHRKTEEMLSNLNSQSSTAKEQHEESINRLQGELKQLKEQLTAEKEYSDWLATMLKDECVIQTYNEDTQAFTSQLKKCVYELLDNNVSMSKINAVIESVLSLANCTANKLPSISSIRNYNVDRIILSQKQVKETLGSDTNNNTTLMTDETSKFGRKVQGYHVSDSSGTPLVLGLREIVTKSGEDTLKVFKEIIDDIDNITFKTDNESAKRLLLNISCTMSDKVSVSSLHSFFCGLHSLVHLAEGAGAALVEVEQGAFSGNAPIFDKSFYKSTESGVTRLIRTCSKAVAKGADDKSGCHGTFLDFIRPFLREKGLRSLPLTPFHGHRFNILFSNAAALWFLKNKLEEFLKNYNGNKLLKAVLHDLHVPLYMAGVKALGLVSKLITESLLTLIEDRRNHILDMNRKYQQFCTFLEEAATDVAEFMAGKLLPFGEDSHVQRDVFHESLLGEYEHDDLVQTTLAVLLPTMAKVARRQFMDHLPGGKLDGLEDDPTMRRISASVPKHNKFAESVFGYFDNLVTTKPNISALATEAYVAFSFNKTSKWLNTKTPEEQNQLITDASKQTKKVLALFKERQESIKVERRAQLEKKMKAAENARQRRVALLESYTNTMIEYGLWQTEGQIEQEFALLSSESQKRKALKGQLNFRHHVFNQSVADKSVYAFSKKENGKSRQLTSQELKSNLQAVVRDALQVRVDQPEEEKHAAGLLVGRRIRHKFQTAEADGVKETWYIGKVVSQVVLPSS